MTDKKRFIIFTKKLAQLSNKYKIAIDSIGGVELYVPDDNIVFYTNDHTSGDLEWHYHKK